MNRKLIRPNLTNVKSGSDNSAKEKNESSRTFRQSEFENERYSAETRKKTPPPTETYAENYYYKKQIDSRTEMVVVLQDGEKIEGTIEWYDRSALKINRQKLPNLLVLKHNIKYMFKAEEKSGKK